jgi:hypothetical protein
MRKSRRRYLTRLVKPAVWYVIWQSASAAAQEDRFAVLLAAVLAWERGGRSAGLGSVRRSIACRA